MEDDANNDQLEIELPIYIELKQSQFASNDLGAFSRMQLNADKFIGCFKGKTKKSMSQCADPNYVWTILSSRQIPMFYIDATDPKDSNWLRFIRSTSDINKYNVICMQQNQQINYFTFREIKLGEELVTYLPGKKKKAKNKQLQNLTYKLAELSESITVDKPSNSSTDSNPPDEASNDQTTTDKPDEQDATNTQQTAEDSKQNQSTKQQIELKILTQDLSKSDDYFFNFDFTLKINNLRKLKRRLIKCDLCSFNIITDSNGDDSLVKYHVLNEHLTPKNDSDTSVEGVVNDLLDLIIKKIENSSDSSLLDLKFSFKCVHENENFKSKIELLKHLNKFHTDDLNKLKCFYCNKLFDQQKALKDYFNHLTNVHKEDIILNQLISQSRDLEVLEINWEDYFEIPKQNKPFKTWTCQMCKKQFDQRVDLSKHQCIELNLRILKKKKELRKKKWREAHWKRKIDLSYIETTSLTQMSQNIADNLSFCIDGTQEDLKAYSREVRDYLSTELGQETQIQMFLKCSFPEVYQEILGQISNLTEANAPQMVDSIISKKANSYFIDSDYLNCKNCKLKFNSIAELVVHQRKLHGLDFKTSFENFKSNILNTSPIGYLACDPVAYLLNLHWDSKIKLKCFTCELEIPRAEYKKHILECTKEEVVIFSARTESEGSQFVQEILEEIISKVCSQEQGVLTRRRKRTAQELIEEQLGTNNIILNKKRTVQSVKNDQFVYFNLENKMQTRKKSETVITPTRSGLRSSRNFSVANSPIKEGQKSPKPKNTEQMITVRMVNNKKVHTCEKCGLEFTSGNSVLRHQEKSCLRVKVINLDKNGQSLKKKCPICSSVFFNTHRLSIHIYRHHKNLLGSAEEAPLPEAKRLNEVQLQKMCKNEMDGVEDEEEDGEDVGGDEESNLDVSLEVSENDTSVNKLNSTI